MDANVIVICKCSSTLECLVPTRECSMYRYEAIPALIHEPLVLREAPECFLGPVSVGDAVAGDHPYTDLCTCISDNRQRSLDGVRCFVVVDDRSRARFQRLKCAELCGPFEHLKIECRIEAPPHLLKDFLEVGSDLWRRRHAPCKFGVEMVVCTDKSWGYGGHSVTYLEWLVDIHWKSCSPCAVYCMVRPGNGASGGYQAYLAHALDAEG